MSLPTATFRQVCELASWRPTTVGEAFQQVAVLAAVWDHATSTQRARLRVAASDEAGLVQRRKVRGSGVTVAIYNAAEQGIDCDVDAKYAIVCETHGGVVCVPTLRAAKLFAPVPDEWCPYCRGEESP